MSNPYIVSIEGNIGAGKSTLLRGLEKHLQNSRKSASNFDFAVTFVDEPLKEWMGLTTKAGVSMLQSFYDNPAKNAFAFQILALSAICKDHNEMLRIHKENRVEGVMVTERCVTSTSRVFTDMLHQKGYISEIEHISYVQMYNEVAANLTPSLIIYLQSDPTTCLHRVKTRARDGEDNISLEYLSELHHAYEQWIHDTHLSVLILLSPPEGNRFSEEDYAKIFQEISQPLA
jgi:deoxyadenosine/deoxycytidine kinase